MHNAGQIRTGDAAGPTHRHPILRKRDVLPWFKKRICFLISKKARLDFRIRAVVVRERLTPIEAVGIDAPRPNFLRRQFGILREMRRPNVCVRVPDAHETLTASVDKQRNRAVSLILYDA